MASTIARTFDASLAIKVPDVNDAVPASGGESPMDFVICGGIDWEHVLYVLVTRCLVLSVTAEGIVRASVLFIEPSRSKG